MADRKADVKVGGMCSLYCGEDGHRQHSALRCYNKQSIYHQTLMGYQASKEAGAQKQAMAWWLRKTDIQYKCVCFCANYLLCYVCYGNLVAGST